VSHWAASSDDKEGRAGFQADLNPSAISLYSGAGGLDLGFTAAGFEITWAIDSDPHAVATYNELIGPHAVRGQLPEAAPPTNLSPTVVIGGPPCQGFSVQGRMDPEDPRSRHVDYFFDVIENQTPLAFCMENVKALATSPRWRLVRNALIDRARSLGYEVELFVLNAADYGVPQARERMFLVGIAGGYPQCPVPTTRKGAPTVRNALAGLPKFGTPGNDTICTAKVVPAKDPVMRPDPYRGSLLFNGSGRPVELDAVARTLPASMGGNATPILDQEELEQGAAPWVVSYHSRLRRGEGPSKVAPRRMRRITVEEAAALQGFPTGCSWKGPLVAQYRQIGNAVPPRLAHAVAVAMREALTSLEDSSPAQEQRPAAAAA
jgi:DNA (cytosine-5)-methyltransferase 1